MAKKGGWKLDESAQGAVNFGKTSRLFDSITKTISGLIKVIIALEKRLSKSVEVENKFDKQLLQVMEEVSKKDESKKEWVFTVERNSKGLIEQVTARSK